MSRAPYHPDENPRTRKGGAWRVPGSPAAVSRPNRTAAGLSAKHFRDVRTGKRKADEPWKKEEVLRLLVAGTLDVLAKRSHGFALESVPCPCCGNKSGKVRFAKGAATVRRRLIKAMTKTRLENPRRLP